MGATFNHEDYLAHHGMRSLQHSDIDENELTHHGILGMKWGIRRFQNKDGSLTELGKKRYGTKEGFEKHLKEEEEKRAAKAEAEKQIEKNASKTTLRDLQMQWGVSRRYQNEDGTLTELGKKRYERKEELEKRLKEKEEKRAAKAEAEKQNAIASGDPKQIKKYASKMTLQELQTANARAQQMSTLDNYANKKPKVNPIDVAISTIDKFGKLNNSIANAAQAAKKVSDLFKDPEEEAEKEREKNFKAAKEKTMLGKILKEYGQTYDSTEGDEKAKARAAEEAYKKSYDAYKKASSGELQKEYEKEQRKEAKRQKEEIKRNKKNLEKARKDLEEARKEVLNNAYEENRKRDKEYEKFKKQLEEARKEVLNNAYEENRKRDIDSYNTAQSSKSQSGHTFNADTYLKDITSYKPEIKPKPIVPKFDTLDRAKHSYADEFVRNLSSETTEKPLSTIFTTSTSSSKPQQSPNSIIADAVHRMSEIAKDGKKVADTTISEIDDYTNGLLDKLRR